MDRYIIFVDDEIEKHGGVSSIQSAINLNSPYKLAAFASAEEAFDFFEIKKKWVDLVISDYAMPGCDGVSFLQSVKKKSPSVKTVLLTNMDSYEFENIDVVDELHKKLDMTDKEQVKTLIEHIEDIANSILK